MYTWFAVLFHRFLVVVITLTVLKSSGLLCWALYIIIAQLNKQLQNNTCTIWKWQAIDFVWALIRCLLFVQFSLCTLKLLNYFSGFIYEKGGFSSFSFGTNTQQYSCFPPSFYKFLIWHWAHDRGVMGLYSLKKGSVYYAQIRQMAY